MDALKLGCGCQPLYDEPLEYEINPKVEYSILDDDYEIFNPCHLKNKIIYEYKKILDLLECGTQPDIEFLIEEISLITINNWKINERTILFK